MQSMKFAEDRTMYAKVISDFVFCPSTLFRLWKKILLTFNPPWQKSNLTKIEAVNIKSAGGVRFYGL